MKLKNILKKSRLINNNYPKIIDFYRQYFISDERFVRKNFEKRLGRKLNLNNPELYNDKLQWLKLYWNSELATICADKYLVRSFVEEKIGSQYLNELYKVYERPEDVDFNDLPDKFVLKGTHGSGFNFICTNKEHMNEQNVRFELNKWFNRNYFWSSREPVYRAIKPRIIVEKYIEQENGKELRDYRFFCFNGEPKFITVDFNINDKSKTRRNLYDLDWNLLDAEISYPKEEGIRVDKPNKLSEMIELSKKLSEDFPHARIDFYYINETIIFGEITFYHQSGTGIIRPQSFEKKMGEWLFLPEH
ncbi:ATP-grasp fold amidoligase family protein [Aerococcus viridans]|uniref:ATP-grasp fold amidoligase family protein n=1 Tax=Aerococcus viridans TaxID=1377 RepID=UPI003AA9927C